MLNLQFCNLLPSKFKFMRTLYSLNRYPETKRVADKLQIGPKIELLFSNSNNKSNDALLHRMWHLLHINRQYRKSCTPSWQLQA
jgi:hypothetical protein